MSAARFLLEHFYYGQFVREGQASEGRQLLAKSPSVSEDIINHVVERVTLPPFNGGGKGSWALVRGRNRQVPFILVQSQQGVLGQEVSHYVIAQPEVLKALGGNLKALMVTLQDTLPMYEKMPPPLSPLELPQTAPPSVDAQIDDILELMMVTKNRTNLIEPLLAAIVQGKQLIIQGAPSDLQERVTFIAGLLALLPPTARFGVTFATHSLPDTQIDAQIRFFSDGEPPEGTVIFDWETKKISGEVLDDEYSRFVISQLRLDAELVIKRNTEMATIAAWRLNEGDKLADALGYASKRIKLDEGLRTNQPVDKDEVSRILAEDPTLTDDLRVLYGQHLVRFSLAMEDMSHAQPVALLLRTDPELEKSIYRQMEDALKDGQAFLVYESLVDWMSNPLGPEGRQWVDLTHQAILANMDELVEDKDVKEIALLLEELQTIDPGVAIGSVVPKIIEKVLPLCVPTNKLGQGVFLLAIRHLETTALRNLLKSEAFRERIDPRVAKVWEIINSDKRSPANGGLLLQAAQPFDAQWEPVVLLRLTEMAMSAKHDDMLDSATIAALLRLATSDEGIQYRTQLVSIMSKVSDDTILALSAPGPFNVLQLHMMLGNYGELARLMLLQSARIYPGDKQSDYVKMVERLFIETPIPAYDVPQMLASINDHGIKTVPYVVAAIGSVHKRVEAPELNQVADETCMYLRDNLTLLEVVPPVSILMLLTYQVQRRDLESTVSAARLVPRSAAYQSVGTGIKMMTEMYKRMDWEESPRRAALRMLRAYIRQINDDLVSRVIAYFNKELGANVGRALELTYLMKQFMGKLDIVDYALALRATVNFLDETTSLYGDSKNTPELDDIKAALTGMPGSLPGGERKRMGRDLLVFGRGVVRLGRQYRSARPREEERYITQLLQGETNPRSILDIFRVMSGYLGNSQRYPSEITPRGEGILRGYAVEDVKAEVVHGLHIFIAAMDTLPLNKPIKLTAREIRDEIESLWTDMDAVDQKQIRDDLIRDLQRIPDLVAWVESNGDAKALEDSGLGRRISGGRHRPKSTLEFYRYLSDYFVSRS